MGKPYDPATNKLAFHEEFDEFHTVEPRLAGTADQRKPDISKILTADPNQPVEINNGVIEWDALKLPFLTGTDNPAAQIVQMPDGSVKKLRHGPDYEEGIRFTTVRVLQQILPQETQNNILVPLGLNFQASLTYLNTAVYVTSLQGTNQPIGPYVTAENKHIEQNWALADVGSANSIGLKMLDVNPPNDTSTGGGFKRITVITTARLA